MKLLYPILLLAIPIMASTEAEDELPQRFVMRSQTVTFSKEATVEVFCLDKDRKPPGRDRKYEAINGDVWVTRKLAGKKPETQPLAKAISGKNPWLEIYGDGGTDSLRFVAAPGQPVASLRVEVKNPTLAAVTGGDLNTKLDDFKARREALTNMDRLLKDVDRRFGPDSLFSEVLRVKALSFYWSVWDTPPHSLKGDPSRIAQNVLARCRVRDKPRESAMLLALAANASPDGEKAYSNQYKLLVNQGCVGKDELIAPETFDMETRRSLKALAVVQRMLQDPRLASAQEVDELKNTKDEAVKANKAAGFLLDHQEKWAKEVLKQHIENNTTLPVLLRKKIEELHKSEVKKAMPSMKAGYAVVHVFDGFACLTWKTGGGKIESKTITFEEHEADIATAYLTDFEKEGGQLLSHNKDSVAWWNDRLDGKVKSGVGYGYLRLVHLIVRAISKGREPRRVFIRSSPALRSINWDLVCTWLRYCHPDYTNKDVRFIQVNTQALSGQESPLAKAIRRRQELWKRMPGMGWKHIVVLGLPETEKALKSHPYYILHWWKEEQGKPGCWATDDDLKRMRERWTTEIVPRISELKEAVGAENVIVPKNAQDLVKMLKRQLGGGDRVLSITILTHRSGSQEMVLFEDGEEPLSEVVKQLSKANLLGTNVVLNVDACGFAVSDYADELLVEKDVLGLFAPYRSINIVPALRFRTLFSKHLKMGKDPDDAHQDALKEFIETLLKDKKWKILNGLELPRRLGRNPVEPEAYAKTYFAYASGSDEKPLSRQLEWGWVDP